MTKEQIIKAYCEIRTSNTSIPDDVLDFMKDSAIKKIAETKKNKEKSNRYYQKNKERISKQQKEYYEQNKEKFK